MNRRMCRLCLAYPSVCFSLLENNLSEMLEALTSIKVNPNDVLSTISCVKCILNMKLAFNIQQNILKADGKLKELAILNNVEVKVEVQEFTSEDNKGENLKLFSANYTNDKYSEDLLKLCCNKCVICNKELENNLLSKHIQEHFEAKQICDLCNKIFNDIDDYKSHVKNYHCEDINHKCDICGVTFYYRSLYNIHLNNAHQSRSLVNLKIESEKAVTLLLKPKKRKSEEGSFMCEICNKEFKFKRQLMSHTHQKKQCPICNAYISKSNFKKHVVNHSSGPQICELCGATLASLESLRGHLSHTHSSVSHTCDECGKVFKKRYPYLLHKKKHSGEKTHICETCGKSFITLYYLNKHIRTTHLKLRPYICQYCQKGFSSKFALRTHVRQHTNETPYKCEVCGEGFRQNVSLRAHRKSKHNIVEAKTCACPVCGKMFSSEQAVISHMRLH